jgi:hypothetical protein
MEKTIIKNNGETHSHAIGLFKELAAKAVKEGSHNTVQEFLKM